MKFYMKEACLIVDYIYVGYDCMGISSKMKHKYKHLNYKSICSKMKHKYKTEILNYKSIVSQHRITLCSVWSIKKTKSAYQSQSPYSISRSQVHVWEVEMHLETLQSPCFSFTFVAKSVPTSILKLRSSIYIRWIGTGEPKTVFNSRFKLLLKMHIFSLTYFQTL